MLNCIYQKETFFIISSEYLVGVVEGMDLLEIIKNRRSIKSYKKTRPAQDIIEKLLEAARWAPSGGNVQSWACVVASSLKVKQGLSMAAIGQKDLEEASILLWFAPMKSSLNKAMMSVVNPCFAFSTPRLQFKISF